MDPEIKAALGALKSAVGEKNVELMSRIDAIEQRATEGNESAKKLREEIESLQRTHEEYQTQIETLQRESRRQLFHRDGVRDQSTALRVLGAICRQELAQHLRQDVPSTFREPEETLIRDYRESLSRDTIQTGATPGSNLVPVIMETELIEAVEEVSDIMSRVNFIPGLPGNVDIPVLTGRPVLQHSRATKDTAMTASEANFDLLQIRPEEQYIYVPVDNNLLLMSALDLGRLMLNLLRDGVIDGLAHQVVAGGGPSGSDSILDAAAAYRYTLPSGKKAFGDITYQDLVKAKASLLKRGRARGVWLGSEDVIWALGDIDRQGKEPILRTENGEPTILHKPVVIDESMPDLTESKANTPFLAFGDLATMTVGLVAGINIRASEHVLFNKNQTAFRATIKSDTKRKPVKTLTTIRTAAS